MARGCIPTKVTDGCKSGDELESSLNIPNMMPEVQLCFCNSDLCNGTTANNGELYVQLRSSDYVITSLYPHLSSHDVCRG